MNACDSPSLAFPAAPFRRLARNLLIAGHRPARLPASADRLAELEQAMDRAVRLIAGLATAGGAALRVVSGVADGADACAARVAQAQGLELHLIAACPPAQPSAALAQAARAAFILKHCAEPLPESLVAAADEAKLALADALLVVWDGEPAAGHVGGSVRLLLAALRQFTPVLWIDAGAQGGAALRLLDHGQFDAAAFAALHVEPDNVALLRALFVALDDAAPQAQLALAFGPFWRAGTLASLSLPLLDPALATAGRRNWSGLFHSGFLALFGPWPRRVAPQAASTWRGPAAFERAAAWPDATWRWFDRCDRAAMRASGRHRDQIVLVELCGSLAVLGAVAGAIEWGALSLAWGALELLALLGIGLVVWLNRKRARNSHAAWMRFRPAAEALRLSALLHPLLASLGGSGIGAGGWRSRPGAPLSPLSPQQLAMPYHWLVTQLLREAGAPERGLHCLEALQDEHKLALTALLDEQIAFQDCAHRDAGTVHQRLHGVTAAVYFAVLATVLLHVYALADGHSDLGHWLHAQRWPLLITAFFPALAAALHGINSKLQLPQVARGAQATAARLRALRAAVGACATPMALRTLALETAATMYAEHGSWTGLMEQQYVTMP
ncbi:alpha-D-ribose 1-methylphosphonate 5-triphosphate synthase subunit PhnH [Janthinobacterium sp. CG_23.3]|uniref:hypothetical protein n=1 Tax=Janthinobacterium sp. CG_23.3 TaxID=3349634 RepID=UPI0038D3C81E